MSGRHHNRLASFLEFVCFLSQCNSSANSRSQVVHRRDRMCTGDLLIAWRVQTVFYCMPLMTPVFCTWAQKKVAHATLHTCDMRKCTTMKTCPETRTCTIMKICPETWDGPAQTHDETSWMIVGTFLSLPVLGQLASENALCKHLWLRWRLRTHCVSFFDHVGLLYVTLGQLVVNHV